MFGSVEPLVRRIVSERLGVGTEDLSPEVSLTDDLAADSLDLLDVAVALESELDIEVPESALEGLRSYGDLVRLAVALVVERVCEERADTVLPAVWVRVVVHGRQTVFARSVTLTPYMAEMIAEDAAWAGPHARVEIFVPSDAPDQALKSLEMVFARPRALGVEIELRREPVSGVQERESVKVSPRPSGREGVLLGFPVRGLRRLSAGGRRGR